MDHYFYRTSHIAGASELLVLFLTSPWLDLLSLGRTAIVLLMARLGADQ